MTFRISRALLARIVDRAVANPRLEICGLLLGKGDWVNGALDSANVADDPARRFEIDPAVLIAAHKRARSGGPGILGHYHSHPSGSAEPSACDAEMAMADGALWLICGPDGDHALWRAGSEGLHGRFARCTLVIEDEDLAQSSHPGKTSKLPLASGTS